LPIRAVRSLILLVAWELWNQRNARIFRRKFTSSEDLVKIKEEATTWCAARAKWLSEIIPRVLA
ncbi:hypothetical protein BAE44_0021431, partial [Dichanthelium oligosanthes]